MSYTLKLFIATVLFAFTLQSSIGQGESKKRVAFYDDIYTVTHEMDRKVNYFSDKYPGFRSAELFQVNDEQYLLEIEQATDEGVNIRTRQLSKEEFEDLKDTIASKMEAKNIGQRYDQSGRYLKVQSLTLQGGLVGITAANYFGRTTESYALPAASPFIGLGSGLLGGIIFTANKDIPLAPTMGYASGAFMGGFHGIFVGSLFTRDIDNRGTAILLSSTALSIGESILLQHIIKKRGLSTARASAIRLGNLSGSLSGLGISFMLSGTEPNKYLTAGLGIGGSVAGMLLYDQYFKNKGIPTGNLQAIRIMNPIFTIGLTAVASDLIDGGESGLLIGAATLATSVGGVFLGETLFKNGNVTYDESIWYGLGLYGGSLIGSGISLLALENANSFRYTTSIFAGITTLFGISGLYAVHSIIANDYDDAGDIGFFQKNNIHIDANPAAVYLNKFIRNPAMQQGAVNISWRF